MRALRTGLHSFVRDACRNGRLAVQPRMGFGNLGKMHEALNCVKSLPCAAVGTLTLDSHTRQGDYESALRCLEPGHSLNGFPIMSHAVADIARMLDDVCANGFPVQVRHGTAQPQRIFERLLLLGLTSTEGGPVSYCLPYSRLPLSVAVDAWREGCQILASDGEGSHIESFGGCLLGQLCPPSLLVAMTIIEGLFFRQHGIRSISLSYAQGTSALQDAGALKALRSLAGSYLSDVDWHVVLYTYMGMFPRSPHGARQLVNDSALLARVTGTERLVVKTVSEAHGIPSIDDNLEALMLASRVELPMDFPVSPTDEFHQEIEHEAECMIGAVLDLHTDIGRALIQSFSVGLLDIPYCLHPDNRGHTRTFIDGDGALRWARIGRLPLSNGTFVGKAEPLTSTELLNSLNYVRSKYDGEKARMVA